jgi:hypothetical protein
MSLDSAGILAALESHAAELGVFERINLHEPKNAPAGLVASIWLSKLVPAAGASGLYSTSALLIFQVRLSTSMLAEPQDSIDVTLLKAVDALIGAYSADFDLNGLVRCVDLLGQQQGQGLGGEGGYINQDGKLLRVFTLSVPLIVDDVWNQGM